MATASSFTTTARTMSGSPREATRFSRPSRSILATYWWSWVPRPRLYSPKCLEKLSEKSRTPLQRSLTGHRNDTFRLILAFVYWPNLRSKRCSYPFSDSFRVSIRGNSGMKRAGAFIAPASTFSSRPEQPSAKSFEDAGHLFPVICSQRGGSDVSCGAYLKEIGGDPLHIWGFGYKHHIIGTNCPVDVLIAYAVLVSEFLTPFVALNCILDVSNPLVAPVHQGDEGGHSSNSLLPLSQLAILKKTAT